MSAKRTEHTAADTASAMPEEAEYDVFISYSRRDYIDENRTAYGGIELWERTATASSSRQQGYMPVMVRPPSSIKDSISQ